MAALTLPNDQPILCGAVGRRGELRQPQGPVRRPGEVIGEFERRPERHPSATDFEIALVR
jgi:hypothetical protein